MAELGVLSGVAGLISLGITVVQGLLDYYKASRSSSDDINRMCESLAALGKTLMAILKLTNGKKLDNEILGNVASSVRSCQDGIRELQKKLDKVRPVAPDGKLRTLLVNSKKRTLYPFRESTLVKMKEICNDLRGDLGLAVNALNM